MKIPNIAKRFEKLLGIDEKDIDYSLHIDAEQGVGFFPLNKSTRTAMGKISDRNYEIVLNELTIIAKDIEFGQGYNFGREQIFYE